MTFVILTGGIDLSVGSVMAFTGILVRAAARRRAFPAVVAIPVMLLGGAADRAAHRRARAVLRRAAVHRLARGAVPRPRSRVRREPRVDQGRGPDRAVAAAHAVPRSASWYITPTGILALLVVAIAAIVLQWTRFGRTDLRDRRQRAVGAADGPERRAHEDRSSYVISGVCARSRGARSHRVLGRGLSAQRRRDRARRDRGGRDRRHAAHRRPRLRARVAGRRARLRHDQDRDLVHGRRAVVDAASSSASCCCSSSSCSA